MLKMCITVLVRRWLKLLYNCVKYPYVGICKLVAVVILLDVIRNYLRLRNANLSRLQL